MGQFDRESGARIGKAVGFVEKMFRNGAGGGSHSGGGGQWGFWARITDTDDDGLYSWQQVAGGGGTPSGWRTGELNAVEQLYSSKQVILDSIVWMEPTLQSGPEYCFAYNPAGTIGKTDADGITGRGIGLGFGNVDLYVRTLASRGQSVEAMNLSTDAVAGNTFVQLKYVEGVWFIDWEQC